MSNFRNRLLIGSVVCGLASLPLAAARAEDPATTAPSTTQAPADADAAANVGVTAVDAGKLIGKNVVDANGDTVGEIESVIVNPDGKVTSVVLDVGGWLEADKRISVPWKDLKADAEGNIRTSLTKETAEAATAYTYKEDVNRGKVLNESGQVYAEDGTQQPATGSMADNNPNNSVNASREVDIPAQNADGSFNASKIVGLKVVNTANDGIGEIGEVLLDKSGNASGVVVDVGGFLGLGSHPVKLAWKQIKLVNQDGKLQAVVDMDKDALKKMPAYDADKG